MKRTHDQIVPLHEQFGIDLNKTIIIGAIDPGLRDIGGCILFACAKGQPGLGIFIGTKYDPFHSMPGKHDFSYMNMLYRTRDYMNSQQEIISSLMWYTVEMQNNNYTRHPNAPGMMSVMGTAFSMASAWGVPSEVAPPFATANVFPYIFPRTIDPDFMPLEKDSERRRHDWNKACINNVAAEVATPREMQMMQTINEDMKTRATENKYRGFHADFDDFLDPLADNVAFLKRLYSDGVLEYDLFALRMKYMQAGYNVQYLAFVTKNEYEARDFPQEWREDTDRKIWRCCIRLAPSTPLSKLLLKEFTFDYYVTDELTTTGNFQWLHVYQSFISWDQLFSYFTN